MSIFPPCFSNAAIIANTGTGNWPIMPSGQITARYGDPNDGTWELSNGAGDMQHYAWNNGSNVLFTLSHSGSGLTLSLSDGPSTTWNYATNGLRVQRIYMNVWSQNLSDIITIDNLFLNGTSISSSLVGQDSRGFMYIYDDTFNQFPTFTLTGTINLAWINPPPPQLQANFTVINTLSGSDVTVNFPNGSSVTYDNVTSECDTDLTLVSNPTLNPPPNFRFIRGSYYDISTSCSYSGNITVVLPYDENEISGQEQHLKLFHWLNPGWEDCTVSVDTVNNTITGQVTTLSPFGIGYSSLPGSSSSGANTNVLIAIALLAIFSGLYLIRRYRLSNN